MPCYSPVPSAREIEMDEVSELLTFVYSELNLEMSPELYEITIRTFSNVHKLNEVTELLCSLIRNMTLEQRNEIVYNGRCKKSRKLADWWEEHYKFDKSEGRYLPEDLIQPDEDGYYTVTLLSSGEQGSGRYSEKSLIRAVEELKTLCHKNGLVSELGNNINYKDYRDDIEKLSERFMTIDSELSCGIIRNIELGKDDNGLVVKGKFLPDNTEAGNIAKGLLETNSYKFRMRVIKEIDEFDLMVIVTFDLLSKLT